MRIGELAKQITPPFIWSAGKRLVRRRQGATDESIPRPEWRTVHAGVIAGCQMLLDTTSNFARLITEGNYEPILTQWLVSHVQPEMVCYDLGGHVGYFTCVMAKLAHKGHVHVCEPFEGNVATIEAIVAKNGLGNVTVHRCAVSDTNGVVALRGPVDRTGSGPSSMSYLVRGGGVQTLSAERTYPLFREYSVESRTLDKVSDAVPDLLKIDVEGAEAMVVAGAQAWMDRGHTPLFAIETHGVQEALACTAFFMRNGYRYEVLETAKPRPAVVWYKKSDG